MKKIWLSVATLLLGSSLTYGYDTEIPNLFAAEPPAEQTVESLETVSGLTPKRPQTAVIRAQQSAPPAPFIPVSQEAPRVAQVETAPFVTHSESMVGNNDTYVYAELERINSELQQIRKDTAKPNPKTSWSTPKLAGRLHHDLFTVSQPDGATPNYKNKAGLNEFRVGITGNGYEAFDYKVEFMMVGNGTVNLVDTWIGAKNVPGLGYFRVGHYNIETGLMYMGGSSNSTLTNFSPVTQSFNLGRKFGASSEHLFANKRIRWIYGVYQGQSTNVSRAIAADNQGCIFNTRLSYAPYFADGGRKVLHIGGHYSYVDEKSSHTSVATFLGGTNFLGQSPLTTGQNAVNQHSRSGLELAYQSGPLKLHSEAFLADYGSAGKATGAVAELAYFLTGEYRAYSLDHGVFVGIPKINRPFHPFKCGDWNLVNGMGAWQAVARYNYTDLGDWRDSQNNDANGGYQHDWTAGLNWFWTPNLRCIFEYTHSTQYASAGRSHQDIFGTSIRVSW